MPITQHSTKYIVSGAFSAKEAVKHVTSVLVGSEYLFGKDEGRQYFGTITIEIQERLPEADTSDTVSNMRLGDVPQPSNSLGAPS